jgi:hypothetical protein
LAYDKFGVADVGVAAYNLFKGVSNGLGQEEITNLTKLLIEASEVASDLKNDFDAAILHIGSAIMDKAGDDRVNPEPPPVS